AFLAAGTLRLVPGRFDLARRRHDASLDADRRRAKERAKEAERLARMAEELAAFGQKAQRRRKAAERRRDELRSGTTTIPGNGTDPFVAAGLAGLRGLQVLGSDRPGEDRPLGACPLLVSRPLRSGRALRAYTFRL